MKKKEKVLNRISKIYIWIGGILLILGTVFVLSPLYPYLWFQLNNESLEIEQENVNTIAEEISQKEPQNNTDSDETNIELPAVDSSLTKEHTLLIPSIGVAGIIHEDSNPERGLKNGVWRAQEWGDPLNNDFPIILASHRFGYLSWTTEFRKLNSFQDLPKTKVGDRITIIWDQRPFKFAIYKAEEGENITDYSADLILYTCKTMNSSIRVFRYATRID